jgi:putative ABC transport system substrate-binding protein
MPLHGVSRYVLGALVGQAAGRRGRPCFQRYVNRGRTRAALIAAVALGLLAAPHATPAQQPAKIPRVGLLRPGAPPDPDVDAFRRGLRDLGYIEGQTIAIESRWAEGRPERLPLLVAELVQLNVDVIVTQGEVMTRSVKEATGTIPIVMAASGDPVGAGLVASLARPGGNVTGLSAVAPDLIAKQLQLLKEAAPKVSRMAILYNPTILAMVLSVKEAQGAARTLGLTVQPLEVRSPDDLGPAFDAMTRKRAQALFLFGDPFTITHQRQILDFAAKRRLPAISQFRDFADGGALMTYGPDRLDMFRRAATYVDKILKGAKPADLPVEQPTRFALVINMKTAKVLALTIPPSVLVRADQVIQ